MTAPLKRVEHDLLGDIEVPADAYWGAHAARAQLNFPLSGRSVGDYPVLVIALANVKAAAAMANRELGELDATVADAIVAACGEIADGSLHEQFVVGILQGGAGTSTNMNANEVVANRALELLGHQRGEYRYLHPNDHVNRGQSTNDVYPTALRIALHHSSDALLATLFHLERTFEGKAIEFGDVVKMGRTQLQDAVPMTLGQEFHGYAIMVEEARHRLFEGQVLLREVNLGGTAIGTGLNAHPDYCALAIQHLSELSGVSVVAAVDLVAATQDVSALVHLSSVLKNVAIKLSKISNDLRLLSSGPQTGLGDVYLPPVQAGSSIMPGKVNPVIPELVNQVAFAVIGRDVTVSLAAEGGQLQLNAFEPAIARALLDNISELDSACLVLADRCIAGITTDQEELRMRVEQSVGLATAVAPIVGYRIASELATEALVTGRGVRELVRDRSGTDSEESERSLAAIDAMVRPY